MSFIQSTSWIIILIIRNLNKYIFFLESFYIFFFFFFIYILFMIQYSFNYPWYFYQFLALIIYKEVWRDMPVELIRLACTFNWIDFSFPAISINSTVSSAFKVYGCFCHENWKEFNHYRAFFWFFFLYHTIRPFYSVIFPSFSASCFTISPSFPLVLPFFSPFFRRFLPFCRLSIFPTIFPFLIHCLRIFLRHFSENGSLVEKRRNNLSAKIFDGEISPGIESKTEKYRRNGGKIFSTRFKSYIFAQNRTITRSKNIIKPAKI